MLKAARRLVVVFVGKSVRLLVRSDPDCRPTVSVSRRTWRINEPRRSTVFSRSESQGNPNCPTPQPRPMPMCLPGYLASSSCSGVELVDPSRIGGMSAETDTASVSGVAGARSRLESRYWCCKQFHGTWAGSLIIGASRAVPWNSGWIVCLFRFTVTDVDALDGGFFVPLGLCDSLFLVVN